jgi:hypothetical protein
MAMASMAKGFGSRESLEGSIAPTETLPEKGVRSWIGKGSDQGGVIDRLGPRSSLCELLWKPYDSYSNRNGHMSAYGAK